MGGLGSGRPGGSGRTTVESCRALNVNRLHCEGCLKPGWQGYWQWMHEGRQNAFIHLQAHANHIVLTYRVRVGGGEWHDVQEEVGITRVPCHFGGNRPYFVCPGVVGGNLCERRVIKLYGAGQYFLCRHCYQLAHESQSEGAGVRALRRTNKIRVRLGGSPGLGSLFPERPKGMWRRTYQRHREQALNAEIQVDKVLDAQIQRILTSIPNV